MSDLDVRELEAVDPAQVGPPRIEWVRGSAIRTTPVGGAGERIVTNVWGNPVGPMPCPETTEVHPPHVWQPATCDERADRWWLCLTQPSIDPDLDNDAVHATLLDTFERLDASLADLPVPRRVHESAADGSYVGRHRGETIDCGVTELTLGPVTREAALEEVDAALMDAERCAESLCKHSGTKSGYAAAWNLLQAIRKAMEAVDVAEAAS